MKEEVSIVGGSAAGFYTARLLAEQGFKVRVFEASERIDPSQRSLIVTKDVGSFLGRPAEKAQLNTVRHYELFTDGRAARISLNEPDLVLERSTLISELASMAEEAGAEILTDRRFLGLKDKGKRPCFYVSHNGGVTEESSRVIVGADGAFSKVAESAGCPRPSTVPLIQAVVDLPGDQSPDTTRVWFLPEETPYFYWLIPHSETQGVLGLIGEDKEKSTRGLERFIEKKSLTASQFQSAEVPRYNGWIPVRRKRGEGSVYLVGDAAGHVKVTTVGGIVTGLKGALGVAETIKRGRYSPRLRVLRAELWLHLAIREVLQGFTQREYSRLLDMLTPSVKHLLAAYSRDEVVRLLWKLLTRQPRFVLLGARWLFNAAHPAARRSS